MIGLQGKFAARYAKVEVSEEVFYKQRVGEVRLPLHCPSALVTCLVHVPCLVWYDLYTYGCSHLTLSADSVPHTCVPIWF